MQAVKNFEVTLSAVHKSSRACQAIVGAIARAPCFKAPQLPASGQLSSLQETCATIMIQHEAVSPFCHVSTVCRTRILHLMFCGLYQSHNIYAYIDI